MSVKSKGSILQQGEAFIQASSMRDELRRAKEEKEKELHTTDKGGVGRPKKMKIKIADVRPMQVSTHYTCDVKRRITRVVERMQDGGVKTASNEEIIFIAVKEWLENNEGSFTVERFMRYREEMEEEARRNGRD